MDPHCARQSVPPLTCTELQATSKKIRQSQMEPPTHTWLPANAGLSQNNTKTTKSRHGQILRKNTSHLSKYSKNRQKIKNAIRSLSTWMNPHTSCLIHPVDVSTDSAWEDAVSPRLQKKKKNVRKRRCAIFCAPLWWAKPPYLNLGESLIHSSKSTVMFACSRVFPLQSTNVIARSGDEARWGWWGGVYPGTQQQQQQRSVAPLPVAPWH